jgi:LTR polyprotein gag-polypeptide-like protein
MSLPSGGNAPSAGAVIQIPDAFKGNPCLYNVLYLKDDGNNYAFWKYRVHIVLDLHDLWTTVDGTISQPPLSAPPEDLAKWSHNDCEAHAQITLTLKDEPLNSVLDASTAKECWDMLASHYEGKGEQSIVHLIDEVFCRTLSDSEALEP